MGHHQAAAPGYAPQDCRNSGRAVMRTNNGANAPRSAMPEQDADVLEVLIGKIGKDETSCRSPQMRRRTRAGRVL